MTEYLPIGISAIASAVAGGVAGALRYGTRIKELETQVASAGSWKIEFDKLKEETRQFKAEISLGARGSISNEAVKSMVDSAIANSLSTAMHEARGLKTELDGIRRDLRDDTSADTKRWSELDRILGRVMHAIETLEKG
jgi:hypothetical protein